MPSENLCRQKFENYDLRSSVAYCLIWPCLTIGNLGLLSPEINVKEHQDWPVNNTKTRWLRFQ